ncbi:HNH endonuclease signature motif containing protein [Hymenobacter terrestris]|uniref:HNH endonuclease n=1 Tax=Hymenobacter terrestris TaxID=2748310 RepID=A0ABX2Q085_9BACT|nr:HNH endonuclease signature motif containing protein [Hymenobacter terrestris]NVO83461.1 HNH endonuclease [Hymenobacter terrestris]
MAASLSVRQVLSRIGLVPAGGNYKPVHARVARLGLDIGHWTGAGWNTGARFQKFGKSTPLSDILVENSEYNFTFGLKNRLLKALLKNHQCEVCNLTEWNGQLIPLELHHLNGVNNDHRLENLQLLCPNCHAQTSNYRGRNQAKTVAN